MTKLKYMSIDTLQEIYAFNFYKVYSTFPTSKHLELNKCYLISKITYLQKQKQSLL